MLCVRYRGGIVRLSRELLFPYHHGNVFIRAGGPAPVTLFINHHALESAAAAQPHLDRKIRLEEGVGPGFLIRISTGPPDNVNNEQEHGHNQN